MAKLFEMITCPICKTEFTKTKKCEVYCSAQCRTVAKKAADLRYKRKERERKRIARNASKREEVKVSSLDTTLKLISEQGISYREYQTRKTMAMIEPIKL